MATIIFMKVAILPADRSHVLYAVVGAVVLLIASCGPLEVPPVAIQQQPTPTSQDYGDGVRIVVLGNSISAGLGLAESDAFPALVEEMLRERGFEVEVVNAGVSGDTTAGGLSRLRWVLQLEPQVVIVELGGNDALRGQPLENTEDNLREIVRGAQSAGANVMLLGMDVPTNYGPDYTRDFAELYERIAQDEGAALVPGFIREVGLDQALMQGDGIHPSVTGHYRLAEMLVEYLEPIVRQIEVDSMSELVDENATH
ncbi:MAG: arylesterase [bacterium]|nr:arylesterase [bacterium]